MTRRGHDDRMRPPGAAPTDEDLRTDVELTRQELAETVAALGAKADVKTRARTAARDRAEAIRTRGTELVNTLPEPVARTVRPVWTTVARRPAIPLGGLTVLVTVLVVWLRIRHR
ncbi:DUF3618 domain-containing protein [Actinophytocola sp.]|uniref:DUF3618 domain-containing protein n=1 Tax=Actinophytocola sp. TaxID=1872138 RepID=UPI003D6ADA89